MLRLIALILLPFILSGCSAEPTWAPEEEVQRAIYKHPGPPTITLMTSVKIRSGEGGHSALLVSGSQRVLFDPAGSWRHPTVPERNDVLYGMTPLMLRYYSDFQSGPVYRAVFQEIEVTPEMAERALALVQSHGAAPKATCAMSISGILQELGYKDIRRVWFPQKMMRDFAKLSGVKTTVVYSDNPEAFALAQAENAANQELVFLEK